MPATLFEPQDPPRLDPDEMYRALCERDRSLDGTFFAGIRTTGIFCRPGCGARKPRRENVEFFSTIARALHAGYRPCLRCRPLELGGQPPEHIRRALAMIEAKPDRRLRAADLRAGGLSPERITRYFKQHYGLTFQAYHRARRVGRALRLVSDPAASIRPTASGAAAAGFQSESGYREAFARLFGSATDASHAPHPPIHMRWLPTPLGPMLAGAGTEGVCFLEWIDRRAIETQITTLRRRFDGAPIIPDPAAPSPSSSDRAGTTAARIPTSHLDRLTGQLDAYFAGTLTRFTVPMHAPGTPFQRQVWDQLGRIPQGQTRSYLDIARAMGRATATRAVARANGDNRLAILVPCHRVIGADGTLTGYGGHLWRKQWLLDHERRPATGSRA
ncbi:MAG: bifunctional transcriptional activator/DNA repair protein Ada [Phycisphaerales bacterium]|nr:bifunctional transcriptional activator/DNA repair protein Ada [Phycisphaerales bacterium]